MLRGPLRISLYYYWLYLCLHQIALPQLFNYLRKSKLASFLWIIHLQLVFNWDLLNFQIVLLLLVLHLFSLSPIQKYLLLALRFPIQRSLLFDYFLQLVITIKRLGNCLKIERYSYSTTLIITYLVLVIQKPLVFFRPISIQSYSNLIR